MYWLFFLVFYFLLGPIYVLLTTTFLIGQAAEERRRAREAEAEIYRLVKLSIKQQLNEQITQTQTQNASAQQIINKT